VIPSARAVQRILARLILIGLVMLAPALDRHPAQAATNRGGAFVLHACSGADSESDQTNGCPADSGVHRLSQVRVRLRGDGKPHLVKLFAAFPEDSLGEIAGTCFGIRYSANVRVWSSGACNGDGIEASAVGWPASGGGTTISLSPMGRGTLIPLYWFLLSAKGPGYFEIVPHPLTSLGARFGNGSMPPRLEPVVGFGRIGFDVDGVLPVPGGETQTGGCCLEGCLVLSKVECDFYKGLFLGPNVKTCIEMPCSEHALKGGCCLPSGCEAHTPRDCARLGGDFLGEGVDCDSLPCPQRGVGRSGGARQPE
jgi:hypothetical protein